MENSAASANLEIAFAAPTAYTYDACTLQYIARARALKTQYMISYRARHPEAVKAASKRFYEKKKAMDLDGVKKSAAKAAARVAKIAAQAAARVAKTEARAVKAAAATALLLGTPVARSVEEKETICFLCSSKFPEFVASSKYSASS